MPTMADYQILQSEIKKKPELQPIVKNALTKYTRVHKKSSDYEKVAAQLWAVTYNTNYRVFEKPGAPFKNARTSYYHKSIGGYHGAKLRRIQELYDYHIDKGNTKVLNMLNARYYIVQDEKGLKADYNQDALGTVWLVNSYKTVANSNEEIMALHAFDPAKEVIVDKRFEDQLQGLKVVVDSTASITMLKYSPNAITYDYKGNSEQLAVFSEMYYQPGWNAYIDGKEAKHFRANYVLRGMRLPAGNHQIEFKFEPKAYFIGENISLASMILFFLLLVAGIVFSIKNIRKEKI